MAGAVQPADVELVLDVPVLHTDDSEEDPALDAYCEVAESHENMRMDWLEHQILIGTPGSAADRAAWRRWASRGGWWPERGRR